MPQGDNTKMLNFNAKMAVKVTKGKICNGTISKNKYKKSSITKYTIYIYIFALYYSTITTIDNLTNFVLTAYTQAVGLSVHTFYSSLGSLGNYRHAPQVYSIYSI